MFRRLVGRGLMCAMLSVFLLSFPVGDSLAGEMEERRVRAGLDLFPSLLAADMDIVNKQNSDGSLSLVLVYLDNREAVEEMARYLERIEEIRNMPVRVELTDDPSLKNYEDRPPFGIFLAQPMPRELQSIVLYGRDHQVIVFSPFEGDVERGVLGGIDIAETVLPYVNNEAMRQAEIRIKPFFLKIAKHHD